MVSLRGKAVEEKSVDEGWANESKRPARSMWIVHFVRYTLCFGLIPSLHTDFEIDLIANL